MTHTYLKKKKKKECLIQKIGLAKHLTRIEQIGGEGPKLIYSYIKNQTGPTS